MSLRCPIFLLLLVTAAFTVQAGDSISTAFLPDTPEILVPCPAVISMDSRGIEVSIWGRNFAGRTLSVEWNGILYPGPHFELHYHPRNEVTLKIPANVALMRGENTVRLYDTGMKVYTNPVKILATREKVFPPLPDNHASSTALDHLWGLWGEGGAVLQEDNIFAFVDLFDLKHVKTGGVKGLPVMGFDISSDVIIKDQNGKETLVPGDGRPASGWKWDGCPFWPKHTLRWWAVLHPPGDLKPGAYTVRLRSMLDRKESNRLPLVVLPEDAPPYVLSLGRSAVVQGYSRTFPSISLVGYNLDRASKVYLTGPMSRAVSLTVQSRERAAFSLPPDLAPGDYRVHLGDQSEPSSNRRRFTVIGNNTGGVGPEVLLHLDFNETMYMKNGHPDHWLLSGPLRFFDSPNAPGKRIPFFWRENLDYLHYSGTGAHGHKLLDADQGTIEILDYKPEDWPPGRKNPLDQFNHGYHHICNIFERGGNWRSKIKVSIGSLYYIPDPPYPASWGYWDVWSYWNDNQIKPQGSWPHFEVFLREGYDSKDLAVVVTSPDFAEELRPPLGDRRFDLKIHYDFVDRKEAAILVRIHGKDRTYVDRTYDWSRKIARRDDRLHLSTLGSGWMDLGTEKRHVHQILDPTQIAKSGAGGSLRELIITDQGFPEPVLSIFPSTGKYPSLTRLGFKTLALGSRSRFDFSKMFVACLYVSGGKAILINLLNPSIWQIDLITEGAQEGYSFTLAGFGSLPRGRYVFAVGGLHWNGKALPPAVEDITVE